MTGEFTKEEKKAFCCGLIAIFVFVIIFCLQAFQQHDFKHVDNHLYHLSATFSRTDGLLVGDLVRMGGVDVGRVIDARLDENFHAVLTLEIKEGLSIPDDSSASIVSSSIMGHKYIEIDAGGSDEFLKDGDSFEIVQPAIVLQEVMDRLIAAVGKKKTENNVKEEENE